MVQDKKKLNKNFLAFIFLSLITLSFSCTPKQYCEAFPSPNEGNNLPPTVNNLETDIYFDATLSMQGFITEDSFSYYRQTLPLLESAVIEKGTGRKARFFKFGTNIEELINRRHLEADKKSFYTDSSYNSKTLIENVIDKADVNHLTVIVTDLFQNNADINQLSDKIKNKFISNDYAVGILAIKSQFKGKVYDVGTNNYSFEYASSAEPLTFRPFYVIVLGPHQEITGYLNTLESAGISGFPSKEELLISRYITTSPLNLSEAKITETKSLNEVTGVLVKGNSNNTYREFKIVGNPDAAGLSMELPFTKLPNVIDIGQDLIPVVEAMSCDSSHQENTAGVSVFMPNSTINNSVNVYASLDNSNMLQMKIGIQPNRLPENSVIGFHIVLYPKESSLPTWVGGWNMNSEQIENWHRNPQSFDGTKTYNLGTFISTLWNATKDIHPPKVAEFYCYFKRT